MVSWGGGGNFPPVLALATRLVEAGHEVAVIAAPHASILGGVSAVVSHGGLSTIMAALAHGVPMVCIPQGRKQPLNAERVEACGAGISLPMDAEPDAIAASIRKVLDDPSYRAGARTLATSIETVGRGQAAAEHIHRLATAARA